MEEGHYNQSCPCVCKETVPSSNQRPIEVTKAKLCRCTRAHPVLALYYFGDDLLLYYEKLLLIFKHAHHFSDAAASA